MAKISQCLVWQVVAGIGFSCFKSLEWKFPDVRSLLVQIYVQLSDAYIFLSEPYHTTNVSLSRNYARVSQGLLHNYPIGGLLIHD